MATESIRVSALFSVPPERIYQAWLSSEEHSNMTGGAATVEPHVGGRHSAWNGYIEGKTIHLEPERRIVQTWRTSEFPADSPHSKLEVVLEPVDGGTRVVLHHEDIPEGQGASYEKGWFDHYFTPMSAYFTGMSGSSSAMLDEPTPLPRDDEDTATDDLSSIALDEVLGRMSARKSTQRKTSARARSTKARTARGGRGASKKAPAKAAGKKPAAKRSSAKKTPAKAAQKAASKKAPAAKKVAGAAAGAKAKPAKPSSKPAAKPKATPAAARRAGPAAKAGPARAAKAPAARAPKAPDEKASRSAPKARRAAPKRPSGR